MACNNLTDLIIGSCSNNSGGLFTTAKVFSMNDVTTYSFNDSTWTVTGLTVSNSYDLEFRRNTSNYTEDANIDLVNGSSFVTATINFVFHRREASKSKAIKLLGEGQQYLGVVVGDMNGKYWYFPYAQVTAFGEGSGTARADGSKYSLTLVAENDSLAYEVSSAIFATL